MQKLRITLFFIFSLFAFSVTKGQTNLVPNPSFETYTTCPTSLGQIYKATGWDLYNGSPDYFNPCSTISSAQVPSNGFGYQLPSNGNSFAGIITYYNGGLSREILGAQLYSPLVVSQKYFVSFLVNRGNDNVVVGYSTNKIGVKFSKVKSFTSNINNSAHYYSNTVITDTLNWVRVAGSFIADSAYQYLMIGNFFDDTNTTITNQSSGTFAYYFIDDVCVSTDSSFTYNYATDILENGQKNEIHVYPNPNNGLINLELNSNAQVQIHNEMGEEIFNQTLSSGKQKLYLENLSAGIYFISVKEKDRAPTTKRIVISK